MGQKALNRVLRQAQSLCRQRGVRLTSQRCKVLEIICTSERPMGAYEILEAMRETVPRAVPPTVYRALDFLLEQGLIHKLESLHAFVGCTHPDHPHASQFLICDACGDVRELEDKRIARSLQEAASACGFTAGRRVVEVVGTCAGCEQRGAKNQS